MKVAFLGLGKMGSAIAGRILAAEHPLIVWNRNPERAQELAALGATVAASATEAVHGADVVFTMLFDDAANEEVLLGRDGSGGIIGSLPSGSIHVSLSTVSVALSERLTQEHARRGQRFVAAPVFGRPNIAQAGKLWVVVAGENNATETIRPLLESFSRGISVIGTEPRQAHALKLGGNFLISAMIHSLSEAFVYAAGQGIEPEMFLETINSALFQSPFYAAYGKVMLHPPEEPGATIDLGAKDLRLLREAAKAAGTSLSLADNLAQVFADAQQAGLAYADWAVGQYKMAQRRSRTQPASFAPRPEL
jgi:3-hydroxyisobutyrate dehydrogenase-like beta-hydroxyacid dehydrogenase